MSGVTSAASSPVRFNPNGPVASTAGTGSTGSAPPLGATRVLPGQMGIEELMMWLTQTLNKSDEALRASMSEMVESQDANEYLSDMVNELNDMENTCGASQAAIGRDGAIPTALAQKMIASYEAKDAWYQSLPDGAKKALESFVRDSKDDGYVARGGITVLRDALKDALAGNNSKHEMKLIELQQRVGARNQALQMISGIVAGRTDVDKTIIQNFR